MRALDKALLLACLATASLGRALHAQVDITSLENSGAITWTSSSDSAIFTVEWSDKPGGPYRGTWDELSLGVKTSATMSAPIPLFLRVVENPGSGSWLTIRNPRNQPDPLTGVGSVNYPYRMGKYEVTCEEYVDFLNAIDPHASNRLVLFYFAMKNDPRCGVSNDNTQAVGSRYVTKPNMADKPVNYVDFWSAVRYVNWLQNGRGTTNTESGAYTIAGGLSPTNHTVSRNPAARYFLPSDDEWYKAAFYDPAWVPGSAEYWLYPYRANVAVEHAFVDSTGNITNATTSARAINYDKSADWNGLNGNVSTVGSGGASSESPYGLADMAGNVYEWTDTIIATNARRVRGGAWFSSAAFLSSQAVSDFSPDTRSSAVGFRVASYVPEFVPPDGATPAPVPPYVPPEPPPPPTNSPPPLPTD